MNEKILGKQKALLLAQSDGCKVFQFRNETGDGTMTCYDVFPGVMLSFNDFHMEYFDSEYITGSDVFAIDHCREGRMEYLAADNAYSYVASGDIKLDNRLKHTGRFVFPPGHYHGLTIGFYMKQAPESLKEQMRDFPIDLFAVREKFCPDIYPKTIHGAENAEHIFSEIYRVPEKIQIPYFKIKVLELLLYLEVLEFHNEEQRKPYFYKTQVEKVKAIRNFLEENMDESYTQEQLAAKFEIPLTTMKNCFKSVYGISIGGWITEYRMSRAAEMLLQEKKHSVAEIAGQVGYDSASKFAIAFRKSMGMSPTEYRNHKR